MIYTLLVIALIGLVVQFVVRNVDMPPIFKQIIVLGAAISAILMLLSATGLLNP